MFGISAFAKEVRQEKFLLGNSYPQNTLPVYFCSCLYPQLEFLGILVSLQSWAQFCSFELSSWQGGTGTLAAAPSDMTLLWLLMLCLGTSQFLFLRPGTPGAQQTVLSQACWLPPPPPPAAPGDA